MESYSDISLSTFSLETTYSVTAFIGMRGVASQAYLHQFGANVQVRFQLQIDFAEWQIYEFPVDYSVDPKLRCRPEYLGRFLNHSGRDWDYIYNVTTTSLILRSLVLFVVGGDEQPSACGSITPTAIPYIASAEFMSGVFGKIYIVQWSGGGYCMAKSSVLQLFI